MTSYEGEFSDEFEGKMRYSEIDTSSEMGSSGQLIEAGLKVEDERIFVAVGKKNKSVLKWALQNSKGKKICIIYVHVPAQMIPLPMGGKFPASQVGELALKDFREKEILEVVKIRDEYLQICAQVGVVVENISIEADSIEEGIVNLIIQHRIEGLIMGAAAYSRYSRKMVKPKSRTARYVCQHAPDFCHIWFVCKGHLIYMRDNKQSNTDLEDRPSNFSGSSHSDALSSCKSDQLSRDSSQSSILSAESESAYSSPCSSFAKEARSAELFSHSVTWNKCPDSSLPSVLQQSSLGDHLFDELEQVMSEAENSKRVAFEDSMRRRRVEKEALEAIHKAKAAERWYHEELRQRKEIEDELANGEKELENAKSELDSISLELSKAFDQKLLLESQLQQSDSAMKELEGKILSTVELLQKYKDEREVLQIERDNALQEAEGLRKEQLIHGPASSHVPKYFTEFSFSELEKATNFFDPSLKIGEGGFGSIYKGFLRHTEVAIKILNPTSMQGPQEFQQEVDVLSKLRHPNLVTLIGACAESWALVYEYLSGGSLADRLCCKDNTPPLPWQTRIRIATDLCSALIFLHSCRPNCIIHGDLKPANVLLDDHFVCKLSDFGICRVLLSEEMSTEQTKMVFTTEPKGTFAYMDPEFLTTGELTTKSDVYSFGIILLCLLTGKSAMGIAREVQYALDKGQLNSILDPSAGDWPFVHAEQLAYMGLRCCQMSRKKRPNLALEVWKLLEPMKTSCGSLSMLQRADEVVPSCFVCPIFHEIMQEPYIAADGYTYEAEGIKGWFDSGHETSPMTNEKLNNHDIIRNCALRSAIQEWLQNH